MDTMVKQQLGEVLSNLHKETGSDLVVITLNSLGQDETYESIEEEVHSKYIFGGENRDKWAMIILTENPYRMNIRIGKGLKKIVPNTMKRALGFEFLISRMLNDNGNRVYRRGAQINLYSTALLVGEAIADDKNVRLHTTERIYENYFGEGLDGIDYALYIPRSSEAMKFIRRYNLYPVILIIFIGLSTFMIFRRRYRRRRFFNSIRNIDPR